METKYQWSTLAVLVPPPQLFLMMMMEKGEEMVLKREHFLCLFLYFNPPIWERKVYCLFIVSSLWKFPNCYFIIQRTK